VIAIVALVAAPAVAAPKKADAKAAFDKGVKAYQAGDYAAASAALGESYKLEGDAETLFAWAQAERKLDHCDKAIELWGMLERYDLPKENRAAIAQKIDECKEILAKRAPPEPTPEPTPVTTQPEPTEPTRVELPPPPEHEKRGSRWKDPVGLTMLGLGVAGLATGTVFTLQARSADKDKDNAPTYDEFVRLRDRAESKGKLGMIGLAAGGALVAGGLVWILTRPDGDSGERAPAPVTGWIDEHGGGLVLTGGF
jgi:hypothetical protein